MAVMKVVSICKLMLIGAIRRSYLYYGIKSIRDGIESSRLGIESFRLDTEAFATGIETFTAGFRRRKESLKPRIE